MHDSNEAQNNMLSELVRHCVLSYKSRIIWHFKARAGHQGTMLHFLNKSSLQHAGHYGLNLLRMVPSGIIE